jgi:hypothetical protein
MRRLLLTLLAFVLLCSGANAINSKWLPEIVSVPQSPLYWNFVKAQALPPWITLVRTSAATNGQYTDAPAAAFTSFVSGAPVTSPTLGLGIFYASSNNLLNSNAPVTQTTGSLALGYFVAFGNGTGTITITPGTAVLAAPCATTCAITTLQGNFQVIQVTTAGTVTVTVSGSVNWFDLQGCNIAATTCTPSPHIVTTGATAARNSDSYAFGSQFTSQFFGNHPTSFVFEAQEMTYSVNNYMMNGLTTPYINISTNVLAIRLLISTGTPTLTMANITLGALFRVCGQSIPGGYIAFDTPASSPVFSTSPAAASNPSLYLGEQAAGGAGSWGGWISQMAFYPRALGAAGLQSRCQLGVPLP